MLQLSYGRYKVMEGHALAVYPQECCGLLLGGWQQDGGGRVMEVYPVTNAWTPAVEAEYQGMIPDVRIATHSQRDRFFIAPLDLLRAQKYSRAQGWSVLGIYHSHPDQVAEPSERDRQAAWPQYSYVILSVQWGRVIDCQSWRLNDQSQFEAEPWQF